MGAVALLYDVALPRVVLLYLLQQYIWRIAEVLP